jgi:hypothetical protein
MAHAQWLRTLSAFVGVDIPRRGARLKGDIGSRPICHIEPNGQTFYTFDQGQNRCKAATQSLRSTPGVDSGVTDGRPDLSP